MSVRVQAGFERILGATELLVQVVAISLEQGL